MSDAGKRIDVCIGEFACSIQGFDDPLEVFRTILELSGEALRRTPAIAANAVPFDPREVETLMERLSTRLDAEVEALEAVPGLVVIHRLTQTDMTPLPDEGAVGAPPESTEDDFDIFSLGDDPVAPEAEDEPETTAQASEDAPGSSEFGEARRGAAGPGFTMPNFNPAFSRMRDHEADENIFADPEPEANEPDEAETEPEEAAAGYDEPDPEERAAAENDIFLEEDTASEEPAGEGADAPATGEVVNIFAAPAVADAPADGQSRPGGANLFRLRESDGDEERPDYSGDTGGRFESLLSRIHHGTAGAPPTRPQAPQKKPMRSDLGEVTPEQLAKTVDAETANELILCAAAWIRVVKGQQRFTRKEVFETFEKIPGDVPRSKEAQIRGFGKLVRNGDLKRIDDEYYALNPELAEHFDDALR